MNLSEKQIRTFICIDFPDEVVKEVARVQSIVSKKRFAGKLTELENIHLTLKFLGDISEENIDSIKEILSKIRFPELNLRLSKAGIFSYNHPRIVWVKVIGNITRLQKEIDNSLEKLFPKEERFMSHLTIARIKHVVDKKSFIDYIEGIKPKKISFRASEFKLKSSELRSPGPVYKTLATYSLASE